MLWVGLDSRHNPIEKRNYMGQMLARPYTNKKVVTRKNGVTQIRYEKVVT